MFFSFLQWLFIVLLILYLSLCLFGDKAKTVAVILIAAAVICQVSFHTFSYFRWLGYPSPAEFVMNLSDSYPGHSVECLRSSKIYYDGMDKIFPDCYKDFLNIYGEPLKEEREDNNLTVDYGGFRAWFYLNGDNSFLQRVEITGKDICLPVSKIRVGDSGRKVEQAYQFSEVVEEDGSRYYLEDCCMLCNVQKRYRIRFEYDTADQTLIHIGKNRGAVSRIYIDVCWLA